VPQTHYDVIILGSSLASDLTATLLSKSGVKVLYFRDDEVFYPLWPTAPNELLNLLNLLNARSCLAPPRRFQVITPTTRVDFLASNPLEEELRREFPRSHGAILNFFQQLDRQGSRLLSISRRGILPHPGFACRGSFELRCLAKRVPWRALARPLLPRVNQFSDPEVRRFLCTLFEGLTLKSIQSITLGEAAFIWHASATAMSFSRSGLKELLAHRFEQFHGRSEAISSVKAIPWRRRPQSVELADGKVCQAKAYLIGSQSGLNLLPEQLTDSLLPLFSPCSYVTSHLEGVPSPFLAPGIILAGESTLRITFSRDQENLFANVENPSCQDPKYLHHQLTAILPFATFSIEPEETHQACHSITSTALGSTFPGKCLSARLKSRLYLCNGHALLPAFGAGGELLVAQAFCRLLGKKSKD